METRAHFITVGAFTLAVLAGVCGFVFWFHHATGRGVASVYRVVFDGSVSGLLTGSSVLFNGIRVGEVTRLDLNPDVPGQVVALIAVSPATPVRADTHVGLQFQGVTGVATLALNGGTVSAPPLVGTAAEPATLQAGQNATEDVTQSVREVLNHVNGVLSENQAALHEAIGNINTFAATLARSSGKVDQIISDAQGATHAIKTLSENLDKRTAEITVGVNRLTSTSTKQIDSLAADAHRTLGDIDHAVTDLAHNPQRILFGGGSSDTSSTASRR